MGGGITSSVSRHGGERQCGSSLAGWPARNQCAVASKTLRQAAYSVELLTPPRPETRSVWHGHGAVDHEQLRVHHHRHVRQCGGQHPVGNFRGEPRRRRAGAPSPCSSQGRRRSPGRRWHRKPRPPRAATSSSLARAAPRTLPLKLGLAHGEVAATHEPPKRPGVVLVVPQLRRVRQAPAVPTRRRGRFRRYQVEARRGPATGGTEQKHAATAPDPIRAQYPSQLQWPACDRPAELADYTDRPARVAQQTVVHVLGQRDRRDLVHPKVSWPPPSAAPDPNLAGNHCAASHRLLVPKSTATGMRFQYWRGPSDGRLAAHSCALPPAPMRPKYPIRGVAASPAGTRAFGSNSGCLGTPHISRFPLRVVLQPPLVTPIC